MKFRVVGQGTALPEHAIDTEEALQYAESIFEGGEDDLRRLRVLFRKSGVRRRHTVVLEAPEGSAVRQTFFGPPDGPHRRGPAIRERMAKYERDALPLAREASEQALAEADIAAEDLTHLVTVSCSGFAAPGVDIGLIKGLGLRPTVERTHVGFMGCHGAINGLRVARSLGEADAGARVLLCAVELCSLHYAYTTDPGQIVANALFADGAAAAVGFACNGSAERSGWSVGATGACLLPDSELDMSWRIHDHGFQMTLSARVPRLIATHLRPWIAEWLSNHGLAIGDVPTWAVHPGGPKILDAVVSALSIPADTVTVSREVLETCGNMSSPTVLFIIKRLRDRGASLPCVALGFGPGMVAEAALFV